MINPDNFVGFLLSAAAHDAKMWRQIISRIVARRVDGDPRHQDFCTFLGEFMDLDHGISIGVSVTRLTNAQQWLLLVMADEFWDQELMCGGDYESWHKMWTLAARLYSGGFASIEANQVSLDPRILNEAWDRFLSALHDR